MNHPNPVVNLFGTLLAFLIAAEAICVIGTHKALVFPWLGRQLAKLVGLIWRGFWRLIWRTLQWICRTIVEAVSGRHRPQRHGHGHRRRRHHRHHRRHHHAYP